MPARVVFMGSDPIALPLLEWLAGQGSGTLIVAVYTQPDRPVGRGQKVVANEIKGWAEARGIEVRQPERLGPEELEAFRSLDPDTALVMAYGHILRQDWLDAPRRGLWNFHASILPRYRGASPIQAAIVAGETESGVTLMQMVRRLDAGPMADVERVPIGPRDTAAELEAKLAGACVPLLSRNWPALLTGTLSLQEQEESAATYCRRLVKDDGAIDFSCDPVAVAARINGLFPWPGCSIPWEDAGLRVGLAEAAGLERPQTAADGEVLGLDAEGLLVACGHGVIRLLRLQRPGGKMLPAAEFVRGYPLERGTALPSRPMPALVANEPFRR
jgi:methionyl-tRNA formyltransferase